MPRGKRAEGVTIVPGTDFGGPPNTLRLAYSFVSPAEIEQVMARHPDVSEVAVVSTADARLGEVAKAYVIAKHDRRPAEAELIEWCRQRLANFKVPRSVEFVAELPRNASGKVLKRELRESLAPTPTTAEAKA